MNRSAKHLSIILLTIMWLTSSAYSFQVLVSLNTYRKGTIENALERVGELKCDGAWLITKNCDFTDGEWKIILETLGGVQITEDNPRDNKSYMDYVRIMGKSPSAAFCYNETQLLPGGTQLTESQIDAQYVSHGKTPLICLTRSYERGPWRDETDRCLMNQEVSGMCMEYGKGSFLNRWGAVHKGIPAIIQAGKPVYLLMHAGGDDWSLEENRKIIENLNTWCPEEMKRDDVYIVYQDYHGDTEAWFGKEGVREAIRQTCSMPNYSGSANIPKPTAPETVPPVNVRHEDDVRAIPIAEGPVTKER